MAVDLGTLGIWQRAGALNGGFAAEIEALGYGTIWIGGSPPGDLRLAEELLDATSSVAVATGIVNVWAVDARTVAESYHRIAARHPGRFLLGVGIGHPEATSSYQRPFDTVVAYLDQLDQDGVPAADRALAALGPNMLRLAAERSAGTHPYLTTPEHTRLAREIMGDGPLLAPEQKVVVDTDTRRARELARQAVSNPYLKLANYVANLRRLGYTDDDLAGGDGSDRLIDDLAPQGTAASVAGSVTAHLQAGADHVCVQVLGDDRMPGYRQLAEVLL
ncbi:LLM class F420-dependent oxidoreductase [Phytoactinopolyspora mesophila]|uniref:TIGR03620 family F420-dependent LLM class oxidoreductase n=1 Tax=Phytoactinopolyspora mesophila TaxID=2650750 RepID=A0A7K3M2M8_9ACTN|nr:LLM class F420-dependent oxidoreductase [Phytoactinopolyspora mesophila]NDL57172.1 TIGR03620 family F420-dependent LLM class oxidoreductase [Phytoactinopolyspora mesophila]